MWFIGVEVEQETSAPPPKKNPGSAPAAALKSNPCERKANSLGQFCYGSGSNPENMFLPNS